ncbi:MAG: hypothetical protein MAG794_00170 [Gammaproteobacteria bacterium]|nr:hypothetical protein [Gammaproteobacteria bacterium]
MTDPIDWHIVADVPPLEPGEVHLWWQDLNSVRLDLESLEVLLSRRESARGRRFKVRHARREFTAARGILKLILSRYLNRPPTELEFRYGPLGKPSMPAQAGGDELCFNYSDTEGFALYAFAWNRELGVDLEALSRQVRFQRIIERRFARKESAALLGLPEGERRRMFLACWTRKEGYGKALGVGIRFPFDCRELCEDCYSSPLAVDDHVNGNAWDIHQLYPSDDFVAALVHPRRPLRQRYFRLRELELSIILPPHHRRRCPNSPVSTA